MQGSEGHEDSRVRVLNVVEKHDSFSVTVSIDGEVEGATFPKHEKFLREDSGGRPRWLRQLVRERRRARGLTARKHVGREFSVPLQ